MSPRHKWIILGILAVLLLGLVVLAASLPQMSLEGGQQFRLPAQQQIQSALQDQSTTERVFLFLRVIVAVFVIFYPIYILISLLTKQGRQRLINDLIRLAVLGLLLLLLNRSAARVEEINNLPVNPAGLVDLTPGPDATLVAFENTTPPWASTGLLVFGAVLLTLLAGAIAWWWFMPTGGGKAELTPRDKLAGEAEQAVQAIEAGENLENVILRTYYRMERILSDERGLERPQAMTPSEFAEALGRQGLPAGAINDLTHLFEAVRYGNQQPDPGMQQRALNAFRAIEVMAPVSAPLRPGFSS